MSKAVDREAIEAQMREMEDEAPDATRTTEYIRLEERLSEMDERPVPVIKARLIRYPEDFAAWLSARFLTGTGHNHDEYGLPSFPSIRGSCPLGCDEARLHCPNCGALVAALASSLVAAQSSRDDERAYSAAMRDTLFALGHHAAAKHQSPQEYDGLSGEACVAPACLAALASSPVAPTEGLREALGQTRDDAAEEARAWPEPEDFRAGAAWACGRWERALVSPSPEPLDSRSEADAQEALIAAIKGQNLWHTRHATSPAGAATALAVLSALRQSGWTLARLSENS